MTTRKRKNQGGRKGRSGGKRPDPVAEGEATERTGTQRAGRFLQAVAICGLLAIVAARATLPELPYSSSAMRLAGIQRYGPDDTDQASAVERTEVSRVTFAVLLLAAAAIWLAGQALQGGVCVRRPVLVGGVILFVLLAIVSIPGAGDKRAAVNVWLEQSALLLSAVLAAQMFVGRRRLSLLMAVLAGIGLAVAAKALWQTYIEIPARVAQFEANQEAILEAMGARPGSPQAELIASRYRDLSVLGYFPLSNLFAALVVVLLGAAAGLSAEKLHAALARRRKEAGDDTAEIDPALVAGAATALLAALLLAVLVMTHSRAGLAAGAAALAAGTVVGFLRKRLARHWAKALGVLAVLGVAGTMAVAVYGMSRGRLPGKSMAFRWLYWSATVDTIRRHPVTGVGGGNFHTVYLRRRRPEAEEAVKMPHNAPLHAVAQFGLPAGTVYAAVMLGLLAVACRPRQYSDVPMHAAPGGAAMPAVDVAPPAWYWAAAACAVGLAAARGAVTEAGQSGSLFVAEAVLPALLLIAGVALAAWFGRGSCRPAAGGWLRIGAGAACGGFVLHSMVDIAAWAPGVAGAFWVLAGAASTQAPGRALNLRRVRWLPAAAMAGVTVAAGIGVLRPVWQRSAQTEMALAALQRKAGQKALDHFARAAAADLLDAQSAADQARAYLSAAAGLSQQAERFFEMSENTVGGESEGYSTAARTAQRTAQRYIQKAFRAADEARKRNPADPAWYPLLAEIELLRAKAFSGGPREAAWFRHQARDYMAEAVQRNPQDFRQRIEYAGMLLEQGLPAQALEQLRKAEATEARLRAFDPVSVHLLTPPERKRLNELRARAAAATQPAARHLGFHAPETVHLPAHTEDAANDPQPQGTGHQPAQRSGPDGPYCVPTAHPMALESGSPSYPLLALFAPAADRLSSRPASACGPVPARRRPARCRPRSFPGRWPGRGRTGGRSAAGRSPARRC
jgi:hypothetical protein